eukprot:Gb_04915 [translate_table: standard]
MADKQRWGGSKVYMRKGHGPGHGSKAPAVEKNERRSDAVSDGDGSSSLSRKQIRLSNIDARVSINLASQSKQQIRELRRKLRNELEQVRGTFKRVEARELQLRGYSLNGSCSASQFSGNGKNGGKEVTSEVASGGAVTQPESRLLPQLSISDMADKGKRTPKANQYYRNSEFVLGKDKFPPHESKKGKATVNKKSTHAMQNVKDFVSDKVPSEVFKQCSLLLTKLMKHKHGWVFNTPVDTKGLGLDDYHMIIQKPMDLGTVKSNLDENRYSLPTEFAGDVRLTFHNAMTYNPQGHDVHVMAEQLMQLFEDRWKHVYDVYMEGQMKSSFGNNQTSGKSQSVEQFPFQGSNKCPKRSGPAVGISPPKLKPANNPATRTPVAKKPKAKDPHKRDMTYEEKQKLSTNLQNLPPERLELIVQIIKKRNPSLCQHDEEIEVDIDSFDTETHWELDRFVTNYKKSLSKNKKKAVIADRAKGAKEHNTAQDSYLATGAGEPQNKNKKGEQGEEHVDIDEDMPCTNFPPVETEKNGGYASRSSSSSSSSSDSGSSSSDSDSGSSSGSESDAYAADSPCAGSKASPRG